MGRWSGRVFVCFVSCGLLMSAGVVGLLLDDGHVVSSKKGVVIGHWSLLCGDFDLYRGRVAWWYDYKDTPTYWTTPNRHHNFTGCGDLLAHRAAMVARWWTPDYVVHVSDEAEYVMGFNEPNSHLQANLTAEQAAAHWPAIESAAGHRPIVGPSPILCGHGMCDETLWPWMDHFFQHCRGCRVDYLAAHLYRGHADQEMAFLERMYHRYHKKIWVTEFAFPHDESQQAQIDYMKQILPRLEAAPFVFRYSWFSSRWRKEGEFISRNASLLEQDSSTLTPVGRFYLNFH